MTDRAFLQLNHSWNAEPNDPAPEALENGSEVTLRFRLNPWAYQAAVDEQGLLAFDGCSKWRLGSTNDEGWYRGQCRYSTIAPAWGEFYGIVGPDALARIPIDWESTGYVNAGKRHFLFYLRDETFECFANEWSFSRSR